MQAHSRRKVYLWNNERLHSQRPLPLVKSSCTGSVCEQNATWGVSWAELSVTASMSATAPLLFSSLLALKVLLIGTRGKIIIPSICASSLVFPLVVQCFFHHANMLVSGLSLKQLGRRQILFLCPIKWTFVIEVTRSFIWNWIWSERFSLCWPRWPYVLLLTQISEVKVSRCDLWRDKFSYPGLAAVVFDQKNYFIKTNEAFWQGCYDPFFIFSEDLSFLTLW